MDSRLSDARDALACLQEAARRGDWRTAGELAAAISRQPPPTSREDLGEYLRYLHAAIVVAKASRAQTAASLVRLNAAAGFHRAAFHNERRCEHP